MNLPERQTQPSVSRCQSQQIVRLFARVGPTKSLKGMKDIDGEVGRLTINVEQLVDRLQLLQEENRVLKQKVSTLTKQLAKLYAELGEAKETIKSLQENLQETHGEEEANDSFAPMTISFEEKLLIRHQLEHLLEQVNLELQRLS